MDVLHTAQQRAESLALSGLGSRQRQRTHRPSVETPVERDQLVALGCVARKLDGSFHCFRSRVAKKYSLVFRAGHRSNKPLGELRQTLVEKIRAGHVDQLSCLFLNGFDNFGWEWPR